MNIPNNDLATWVSDDGSVTLYHGDCLEVLSVIEVGVVDTVITDPPYGISYQSARRSEDERFDVIAGDEDLSFLPKLMDLLFDATKKDAHAYLFCRWDKWPLPHGKWQTKNMIVWDKTQHGTGDLKDSFGPQHELCGFFVKGRRGFSGKRPVDVLRYAKIPPQQLIHSCEKPVPLISALVGYSSNNGDTVIDPFMGSGTTGIACIRSGRKFIGIEKDAKYFEIAKERIRKELQQGRLF